MIIFYRARAISHQTNTASGYFVFGTGKAADQPHPIPNADTVAFTAADPRFKRCTDAREALKLLAATNAPPQDRQEQPR